MIDHVSLQVADLEASARLYDVLLAPLGGTRRLVFENVVGFGVDRPCFWLGTAGTDGIPKETHVAFVAPDRDAVHAFHQAAIDFGAEILHAPQTWPRYHPAYFAAFVRDPDGNNIEAVCHTP